MRGGKRPGAGRKKGIPNKASAAREREAGETGLTPRDVMLAVMREFWSLAQDAKKSRRARGHHLRSAAAVAKDLAPYIHPRIATTSQGNNGDDFGADGAPRAIVHRVEIIGGLPQGSTPEKPEGDNYPDVPPEESMK